MTQNEAETLKIVEKALNDASKTFTKMFGDALEPEMIAIIFGSMMAAIDAAFAIRDGHSWRGLTDPKEIAAKLLRDAKIGDS